MQDLPVYLINLEGSDDRLAVATAALGAQGAAFTRHPAYDGRGMDVAGLPEYDTAGARAFMGRDLTGGEVGCYISHVEAARRFIGSQAVYGLVLEDDMKPAPGAFDVICALISEPGKPDWHVAHLAPETLKISTPLMRIGEDAHVLHLAHYFPMRTTALLWSRVGAQQFVEGAYPITCPVDIHLRRWLQTMDKGVAIAPALFTTTEATSEIAGGGPKRGADTRSLAYPVKRLLRMTREKRRARALQRRAVNGLVR